MKSLAVICLVLGGAGVASAQIVPPEPARISITATLEAIRSNGPNQRVRYYLLWNKQITARPLGYAYMSCNKGPQDVRVCPTVYSLPYGKITALGTVHSFARFSLVITAGTQSERARREGNRGYAGIQGTVTTWRVGPGTFQLSFQYHPRLLR
jgi:hypothetical protein